MRRWLPLVVLMAACRADRVEPGRYACDPAGDRSVGSSQCPGESRCGLEGYCHPVGEVGAWRCETAADCEGGFTCGLGADGTTRECHDPTSPAAWRCASADDCAASWVCGLNDALQRQCHDPTRPRAWPCVTAGDCAGGWSCGLSRTGGRECHDPTMPSDWPCVTTADCVGGWSCGLSRLGGRECHDPARPAKWRCETNADCLGGWQCGIGPLNVRECHDPSTPEAWACVVPSDCLGGWLCGLNDARNGRQCHDPMSPRAFACETASDCVANWLCGLAANRFQRECRDPLQPRSDPCANDGDCVGGWRCGLEGVCLDPAAEALEVPPAIDAGASGRINPVQQLQLDVVGVSPFFLTSQGRDLPTFAALRGGTLQALVREPGGGVRTWDLGPTPATTVIAQGPRSYEYDSNTDSYRRTDLNRVYTGGPQGVRAFTLLGDGGMVLQALQFKQSTLSGRAVTKLKHGSTASLSEFPTLLGFSSAIDRYYAFDGPQSGLIRNIDGWGPWTLQGPLLDLDAISVPPIECVFLVEPRGLWISQYDNYGFEPVHSPSFGNGACGAVGQRIERISTFGLRAAVVSSAWDGGVKHVSVLDLTPTVLNPTAADRCTSRVGLPCQPTDQIPFSLQLGPCVACPAGELLDVATIDSSPPALETRCGGADGGPSSFFRITSTPTNACSTQVLLRADGLFIEPDVRSVAQPSQGRAAFSSPTGQVWLGASTLTTSPLSLDRAAQGVARRGTAPDDVVVVADGVMAVPTTGLGLSSISRPELTAVAANEPFWVIDGTSVRSLAGVTTVDEGTTLAVSAQALPTPQTLHRVARGAVTEVVVTAGTQLSSAAVAPPGVRVLLQRVATVNPITSAAFVSADAGIEGYLITSSGVSAVTSDSETRWRVQELTLPSSLSAREVWFARGRARVGFSDGVVFSLPSRLRIAEPVPGGVVEDYAQACGQQLALTSSSLLRLVTTPGAAIGRWEPLPLPMGFATLGLFGGRVHAAGADLYVFSPSGETAKVTLTPCP
ncbi:MAG: hypothetical protein JNJ54_16160 [Myxococcaceae bacterium]|nr:hypothetical protein [Myxococcaceae bacterium]